MLKLPLRRDQLYTQNNVIKSLCLIKELSKPGDEPIFTIRDEKEGYESLKTLFVNLTVNDPSEAVFAETVFNDVGYWIKVRENKVLQPYIEEWRIEAAIKRKSIAYQSIVREVQEGGKSAFSAAKYLIDEPYEDKRKPEVKEKVAKTKQVAKDSVYIPEGMEEFISSNRKVN